jgi:hypothetical protein
MNIACKRQGAMLLVVALGMALVLSGFALRPAKAQVPPIVELRCGQTLTGLGNVVLNDGVTPVPAGCLVEVRNALLPSLIVDTFYIGEGTNAPVPPFTPLAGHFDVYPSIALGTQIFLRAYNNATPASATLWGDSYSTNANFTISASGTWNFAGWRLGVVQDPITGGTGTGTSYYNGTMQLNTNGVPVINDYDLLDAANASKLNTQLNVTQQYHFMVNITDMSGINNINRVTVYAWHDEENSVPNDDINTHNYGDGVPTTEFALQYSWYPFAYAFNLVSTHTNDSAQKEIYGDGGARTVWGNNTMELNFYFYLGEQMRYAWGDGNWTPAALWDDPASAFNDLGSWNFHIEVMNNDTMSAHAYDEFGVYRYTNITAGPIFATGLPGQNVAFDPLNITYSSNAQYNLGVYINRTLTRDPTLLPSMTIGPQNISTAGGFIPKTAFADIGAANTIYYYPAHVPPTWGRSSTLTVQFWVYIPLNVLGGRYDGDLVYLIEHTT